MTYKKFLILILIFFYFRGTPLAFNTYLSSDLRINGFSGIPELTENDDFFLEVNFDPQGFLGNNADWWLIFHINDSWYYFDLFSKSLIKINSFENLKPTYQGPLIKLNKIILPLPQIVPGSGEIFFGIDQQLDGQVNPETLFYVRKFFTVSKDYSTIRGQVVDDEGHEISGAYVFWWPSNHVGTQTSANGSFELNIPKSVISQSSNIFSQTFSKPGLIVAIDPNHFGSLVIQNLNDEPIKITAPQISTHQLSSNMAPLICDLPENISSVLKDFLKEYLKKFFQSLLKAKENEGILQIHPSSWNAIPGEIQKFSVDLSKILNTEFNGELKFPITEKINELVNALRSEKISFKVTSLKTTGFTAFMKIDNEQIAEVLFSTQHFFAPNDPNPVLEAQVKAKNPGQTLITAYLINLRFETSISVEFPEMKCNFDLDSDIDVYTSKPAFININYKAPIIDSFTYSRNGNEVHFSCQAHDPQNFPLIYHLYFGDQTLETNSSGFFVHSYLPGRYQALCIAENILQLKDTKAINLEIEQPNCEYFQVTPEMAQIDPQKIWKGSWLLVNDWSCDEDEEYQDEFGFIWEDEDDNDGLGIAIIVTDDLFIFKNISFPVMSCEEFGYIEDKCESYESYQVSGNNFILKVESANCPLDPRLLGTVYRVRAIFPSPDIMILEEGPCEREKYRRLSVSETMALWNNCPCLPGP